MPNKTESEVINEAQAAIVAQGFSPSSFNSPVVFAPGTLALDDPSDVPDNSFSWTVFFDGTDGQPGNELCVHIDDDTPSGNPVVFLGR
jgi:hypothetical protein